MRRTATPGSACGIGPESTAEYDRAPLAFFVVRTPAPAAVAILLLQ
jgi:hypothetical protein